LHRAGLEIGRFMNPDPNADGIIEVMIKAREVL
jgi:hypothetical protein